MEFLKSCAHDEACIILWDEHLDWRDEISGATLLHVACWTGNINLFRSFCNDLNVRGCLQTAKNKQLWKYVKKMLCKREGFGHGRQSKGIAMAKWQ